MSFDMETARLVKLRVCGNGVAFAMAHHTSKCFKAHTFPLASEPSRRRSGAGDSYATPPRGAHQCGVTEHDLLDGRAASQVSFFSEFAAEEKGSVWN